MVDWLVGLGWVLVLFVLRGDACMYFWVLVFLVLGLLNKFVLSFNGVNGDLLVGIC